MSASAIRDELVQAVSLAGGLAPEKASAVVEAMLRFLGARLPSPLFGELQDRLQAPGAAQGWLPVSGTGPSP
jgi:hypothetical protein